MSDLLSLLSGGIKGYTDETGKAAAAQLEQRKATHQATLDYLTKMASSPDIPIEHRQWAMQKLQEGVQHDFTKKPFKVDLSELPPVMRQPPDRQGVTQAGGMNLQAPTAPPATAAAAPASGDIGTASSGKVNALGASGGGIAPPAPPPGLTPFSSRPVNPAINTAVNNRQPGAIDSPAPPALSVPGAPSVAPASIGPGAATVISNPQPPQQVSPAGQIHLMTPTERAQQNLDTTQATINQLQKQYPAKSVEDLAYFAQHGEFPKEVPDKEEKGYNLSPGQVHFDKENKKVAENTNAPPEKPGDDFKQFYGQYLKDHNMKPSSRAELSARSAWNAANPIAQQHLQIDLSRLTDQEANALSARLKPYQGVVDEADAAEQLKQQGDAGNASADVDLALTFFKVIKGASGSGIRFTQQEQNLITGARGLGEAIEVKGNKVLSNGQPLAAGQRERMMEVIRMHKAAAQRRMQEITDKAPGNKKSGGVQAPAPPSTGAKYTVPAGAHTATNPTNGHKINVDGGRWVDSQTGQPIQ